MPGSRPQPFLHGLMVGNLTAIYIELVEPAIGAEWIEGRPRLVKWCNPASPCLFVTSVPDRISKIGVGPIERVTKRGDRSTEPAFNQVFGFARFNIWLRCHSVRMMSYAVASNLVSAFNYVLQHRNIVSAPIDFPPIVNMSGPTVMSRVLISNQKKGGWDPVPVENGNRLIKLTTQPVIECQRYQCWLGHFPRSYSSSGSRYGI